MAKTSIKNERKKIQARESRRRAREKRDNDLARLTELTERRKMEMR